MGKLALTVESDRLFHRRTTLHLALPYLRYPPLAPKLHSSRWRSRSALLMTDTELNVIAALASIGLSSSPNTG